MSVWFECVWLLVLGVLAWYLVGLWQPQMDVERLSRSWYDVRAAYAMTGGHFVAILPQMSDQPLYPMLLAALGKLQQASGFESLRAMARDFNLWLYWISILLVQTYAGRQVRKPYSLIVTTLYAIAPLTVLNAISLTPGMLFTVLSMLALLAIDKTLSRGEIVTAGRLLLCGSLIWAAILTSELGYCLLAAFAVLALQKIDWRRALSVIGGVLAGLLPWYAVGMLYQTLPVPAWSLDGLNLDSLNQDALLLRVGEHLTQTTVGRLDLSAVNSLQWVFDPSQSQWMLWLVGGFSLLGLSMALFRSSGICSLYVVSYCLMTLCLYDEVTYYTALLPLLLQCLFYGLMQFGNWARQLALPVSRILSPAVTVLILLSTLSIHARFLGH